MTDLVVAARIEPQRSLAAALHHLMRWRRAAAEPAIEGLDVSNAHQMRDLGLDADHYRASVGERLWSSWSSSPRPPFSM